jgi:Flp pilus assembly protein TadD
VEANEAFELGVTYLDKKDLDNALVAFSQALRLDPEFAPARNGRAVVMALQGDIHRALIECCEAIRLDPQDPEFYRTRAYIYERMGNDAEAEADFAKAEELEGAQ